MAPHAAPRRKSARYDSTEQEKNYWTALQTKMASGSGASDVQAIEVGRVLDELHYRWYEEPVSDYHIPLLRRLVDELHTPILAGEKTTPVGYLPEYVRQGATSGPCHTGDQLPDGQDRAGKSKPKHQHCHR